MSSLFGNLSRWARRQKENFVTEAFGYLANYLLEHEQRTGQELLKWLCCGEAAASDIFPITNAQVILQSHTDHGKPDIEIAADDLAAFIEVKKDAKPGPRQLDRYRLSLDAKSANRKYLILLAHFPNELHQGSEQSDRGITWHEVAKWLDERTELQDPVAIYLVRQFVDFLKEERMAIQHVGREYVLGMEAYVRLVTMIDRALIDAEIPMYKRPRVWKDNWICYVGSRSSRPFCIKIRFKNPTQICFEFFASNLAPGKQLPDDWHLGKSKPYRVFKLTDSFFAVEAQEQSLQLQTFFKESYEAAKQLCAADQPPSVTT